MHTDIHTYEYTSLHTPYQHTLTLTHVPTYTSTPTVTPIHPHAHHTQKLFTPQHEGRAAEGS